MRSIPRARGCGDPLLRTRLLPYLSAGVRDDEAEAFEAHLLLCATCFRDLKTLARARELIDELSRTEP